MERNCVACPQVDDHPRHVVAISATEDVYWHLDCHAKATITDPDGSTRPSCESCIHQTRNQGDARGDAFREILTTQDGA